MEMHGNTSVERVGSGNRGERLEKPFVTRSYLSSLHTYGILKRYKPYHTCIMHFTRVQHANVEIVDVLFRGSIAFNIDFYVPLFKTKNCMCK